MTDSNVLRDIVQRFPADKRASPDFAVAYVDFMSQHENELRSYLAGLKKHDRNLTLINNAHGLETIARRLALVSDLFVFGETSAKAEEYFRYDEGDNPDKQAYQWGTDGFDVSEYEPYDHVETRSIYTSNWVALRRWLDDMRSFLLTANAVYLPRIEQTQSIGTRFPPPPTTRIIDPLFKQATYIVQQAPRAYMESPLLAPLFRLDIPFIEQIDGQTLFKLCQDEQEAFQRLQDTLRLAFMDAEKAWGSETYEAEIEKIQRSVINDGLRQIRSDMKTIRAKSAVQTAGAAIGYVTLGVYIVLGLEPILSVLGPAGLSVAVAKQVGDYLGEVKAVKEKPMYFLWKLEEISRGKQ